MQIQEISAHPGPVPGRDTRREDAVCKYIDVTTCIGCKACEVACVEWNDHPFRETVFDNTYQTMPSTEWNPNPKLSGVRQINIKSQEFVLSTKWIAWALIFT